MNKTFLNDVNFERDIRIKRPKKGPTDAQLRKEKQKRKDKRHRKKVMRLVYFIFTVAAIVWSSIFACETTFSYVGGRRVKLFPNEEYPSIVEILQGKYK